MAVFDCVLLLIISETTQQAMIGEDFSMTNAVVLVVTCILAAARRLRGLENLSQIKYAVLEKDGEITIIPYPEAQRM